MASVSSPASSSGGKASSRLAISASTSAAERSCGTTEHLAQRLALFPFDHLELL